MTFEVTIDSDTSGPIQEGDTYEVTASVTNSGSNTQTQTIHLYTNPGQGQTLRDNKEITVDPGDTVPVTLTWNTTVGDAGTYEVSVESEDPPPEGVDTDDVTIETPPPFPVTVQSTNSPVTAGGTLTVTAGVENTGEQADTQDVTLSVGGSQRDSTEVQLENGQSTEVDLTWETGDGDAGTYDAAVASATDQDTTDVTVESDAEFVINDLTVENAPVTEGEEMCIACTVENTGSGAGARLVGVGIGNEALPKKKTKMVLQSGGSADLHFGVEQGEYREGNDADYEKKVWGQTSFDDLEMERGVSPPAETTTQVTKPPHFATTIESTNAPVEEGEDLAVTATVENTGGETGPVTVALAAKDYNNSISNAGTVSPGGGGGGSQTGLKGGTLSQGILAGIAGGGDTVVDDTGLELAPGESEQVTLEWNTNPGNAGDRVLNVVSLGKEKPQRGMVIALDDEHTAEVDWGEPPPVSCLPGDPVDDTLVSVTHGPMRTGHFVVELDGEGVPGWQEVKIPGRSVEQAVYGEGGDNPDEVPWGRATFDDLTMVRGAKAGATELYDWFEAVRNGQVDQGRKSLTVTLLDENDEPQVEWQLQEAWIKNYDPPELDASADGDVATESATIAYDKMDRTEL